MSDLWDRETGRPYSVHKGLTEARAEGNARVVQVVRLSKHGRKRREVRWNGRRTQPAYYSHGRDQESEAEGTESEDVVVYE